MLEMPVEFCLNLLSTGELEQIQRALPLYGLVDAGCSGVGDTRSAAGALPGSCPPTGYYERALAACTDYARGLCCT